MHVFEKQLQTRRCYEASEASQPEQSECNRRLRLHIAWMYMYCTFRLLKNKWQERSDLIGRLEQEVKEMRNQFDVKEKKLLEEKNKAVKAGK